jgi:hypothetical protein
MTTTICSMYRRRQAQIAAVLCAWLLCAAVTNPLVIWVYASHGTVADCECPHGTGAMCPMHKSPARTCVLRSATNSDDLLFMPLVAPVGPLRSSLSPPSNDPAPRGARYGRSVIEHPLAPESPPPRV